MGTRRRMAISKDCVAVAVMIVAMNSWALSAHAQTVDDVLRTAWEASWRQTGELRAVARWESPIRVAFSGTSVERHKQYALQQLKVVADAAGLDLAEGDGQSANLRVEFLPSHTQ